jgi:cytoskeleton protein RodZ
MAENQELGLRERAPGAALSAARTAQNLSLIDVARQLKLSVNQVAALEAGEFERLPGPVFVRGFVRNYARLLKLDPERILDLIVPDASGPETRSVLPASRDSTFHTARARRGPALALLLVLALAALAAYEFYLGESAPVVTAMKPGTPSASSSAPTAETARAIVPAATPDPQAPAATESETPAPTAQPAQGADEATATAPQPVPVGPPADAGELRFSFGQQSWVQIRERDGKAIFTRLNPAGSEQRVTGKPPFTLVIGNAHEVRLTYNERPVDLEPQIVSDDVARFTLE